MATEVILTKVDHDMLEGTIVEWMKKEGEWVEKGEVLYVLETEKVTLEIEAPASGFLAKVMAKAGDTLPAGTVIAFIVGEGEPPPETPVEVKREGREDAAVATPVETSQKLEPVEEPSAQRVSPVARRMAKEHNIDLSRLTGTGPGGRVIKEDVLHFVEEGNVVASAPPEAGVIAEEEVVPLSTMRGVIARRMVESFQTPHFYLTLEADAQELQQMRQQLLPVIENKTGIRLTLTDLIIKIVAGALEQNPAINCSYADGSVKLFRRIDIGLVTSVEGGLLVPVLKDANTKLLAEITQARAELVRKARKRTLTKEEMTGSTFTISNMGMYDIDQFSAIIQPPEAAILAVGKIAEKVVVRKGKMVIRPVMNLTLSIDHRVLDGALGARFLQTVKNSIERPSNLFLSLRRS